MPPRTTTAVPPWQQGQFRDWLSRNKVTDYLHPQSFYDYGGAFLGGAERDPVTDHWPDTWKQPGHPTFSDESMYADETAGHWENGVLKEPPSPVAAAHAALSLPTPDASNRPGVPFRRPAGQPYLTHEKIASLEQRLGKYAANDLLSPWERAKEFASAWDPRPMIPFVSAVMNPGGTLMTHAMSRALQGKPLATEEERKALADGVRALPQVVASAPEHVDNFIEAIANRDPHALGVLSTILAVPMGAAEADVARAGTALALRDAPAGARTALREVLPELEYTIFKDEAHGILGLPKTEQKLLSAGPPVEPELLSAKPAGNPVDGYEMSSGRFVTRDAADKIPPWGLADEAGGHETILRPAVQGIDGKWYTGPNHDRAWARAAEEIRKTPEGLELMRKNGGSSIKRGSDNFFEGPGGKILTREEAMVHARRTGQTVPELHEAHVQLHSSDLKSFPGSPYAAKPYEGGNPAIGTPEQMHAATAATEQQPTAPIVPPAPQSHYDRLAFERAGLTLEPKTPATTARLAELNEILARQQPIDPMVGRAHDILGLPQPERIAPTPGALANFDTQPFESLQLPKPLREHTDAELNALNQKVAKSRARAVDAEAKGAIGMGTRPYDYDLQVLNDERARRAGSSTPIADALRPDPNAPRAPGTTMEMPAGAHKPLWDVTQRVRENARLTHPAMPPVTAVDPEAGRYMAETYERLTSEPNDPIVRQAYDKFISETQTQYDELRQAGFTFDFVERDPYKNSAAMTKDLRENKHLSVFKSKEGDHPLMTVEQNNIFRAVHDAVTHATHGYQFGPIGEENAYRAHSYLYSPEAQRALATETRGQNSWVNFGPQAKGLAASKRPYAAQKAALWPKGQLGEYDKVLGPKPRARKPMLPVERTAYHGTDSDVDFSVPTLSKDLGPHVGTPGQAFSRITPDKAWGPPRHMDDITEGGRVLRLKENTKNPVKLTADLGTWPPDAVLQQLRIDGILTPKETARVGARMNKTHDYSSQHAILREELLKRGYDAIEYPNAVEPSGWQKTGGEHPVYNDDTGIMEMHSEMAPRYSESKIILDPTRNLRNPLDMPGAKERNPLDPWTKVSGSPIKPGLLAKVLKRHGIDPNKKSDWLGAGGSTTPGHVGARPQSLSREDIRGLGMVAASDAAFGYDPNFADYALRKRFPGYAQHLDDPKTSDLIRAQYRKFQPIAKKFATADDIQFLVNTPEAGAIREWYNGWQHVVKGALPPEAAEMLTRFSAILSAQKSPEDEVGMALSALDHWAHGEHINTSDYLATTGAREAQLREAASDRRWGKKAFKTSGYYLARKGFGQTGALDRHVIRAYTGSDRVTPAAYEVLWHRVNADADLAGIPFSEFQAMVWGGQTKYSPSGPGAAPEEWLARHLASGNFDRLIKKYPGLEKLRAKGERLIEQEGREAADE